MTSVRKGLESDARVHRMAGLLARVEPLFEAPLRLVSRSPERTVSSPNEFSNRHAIGMALHYADEVDQVLFVYVGLQYAQRGLDPDTHYPMALFLGTSLEDGILDDFLREIQERNPAKKLVDCLGIKGRIIKHGKLLTFGESSTQSKRSLYDGIISLPTGSELTRLKGMI